MVIVPKANGKVRICVHPFVRVWNMSSICNIRTTRYTYNLHGLQSFPIWHQIWILTDPIGSSLSPVDNLHYPLWGVLFWQLAIQQTSALEHFQCRRSKILNKILGVVCMMDDEGTEGKWWTSARTSTRSWSDPQQKSAWFRFRGHVIDQWGIRPDPDKMNVSS